MHSVTKQARILVSTPDPPMNDSPIAAESFAICNCVAASCTLPLAAHTHTWDNYESCDWRAETLLRPAI